MARHQLPDRRPAVTVLATWQTEGGGHKIHLTAGYDLEGRLREVFYADGQKTGAGLRDVVQDACVLVSLLLQHDVPLDQIAKSMASETIYFKTVPTTIIGTIVRALGDLDIVQPPA
jgi:hypothetical protein